MNTNDSMMWQPWKPASSGSSSHLTASCSRCGLNASPRVFTWGPAAYWLCPANIAAEQEHKGKPIPARCGPTLGRHLCLEGLAKTFLQMHCRLRLPAPPSLFPPYFTSVRPVLRSPNLPWLWPHFSSQVFSPYRFLAGLPLTRTRTK